MDSDNVSYDFINDLSRKTDSDIIHIDVREPKELAETGTYPHSINITLSELEKTLNNLSPGEFHTKFGKKKPDKDAFIIVSCKMGGRSAKAQVLLRGLGFNNVHNYSGGWVDWEKNQKV